MHRDGHTDASIGARQLLENEDVRDEVRAGASVLLGDAHAHEPQLGELGDELIGEAVLAIPLRSVGSDLRVRELARERLDRQLVGAELEVHRGGL
jgi:hypothetical protein